MEFHQGIERAAFVQGREERSGIYAQEAAIYGEIFAVGIKSAEDDKVSVQVFGDVEHGGAAEFGGSGNSVALQVAKPAGMRVNLFSSA
jgi:hypothetical protein